MGTTSQQLSARDLEQAAARWPLTCRLSLSARNLNQLGMVVKRLSAGIFPNLKDLELHLVRLGGEGGGAWGDCAWCVCVGEGGGSSTSACVGGRGVAAPDTCACMCLWGFPLPLPSCR